MFNKTVLDKHMPAGDTDPIPFYADIDLRRIETFENRDKLCIKHDELQILSLDLALFNNINDHN